MQLPLYLERVSADRGEMEASKAAASRLIGAIIVEKNLVTAEQLERALQLQEQTGERLGEIVVAEFGVSRLELAGVLAEQWADFESADRRADTEPARPVEVVKPMTSAEVQLRRPIGEIFVELGFVTDDQLDAALVVQGETGARIGEVLVEQGSLSRLDLASALAEQWSALQKLRPPTPAPDPQPWQNGVPVLQSSPPENAAEVAAIEGRLRVVERAAAATPWQSELDAVRTKLEELGSLSSTAEALAALQEQVHRLETLPDRVGELADLGVEIETLAARLDDLAGVAELQERLDAVAGQAEVAQTKIAGLSRRVDDLAELTNRIDAVAASVPGENVIEELRSAVADLSSRPAEADPGDQRADIASLTARIDRYGARVENVASTPVPDLTLRIGELESRIEAVQASVPDTPTELLARLDRLEAKGRSEDNDLVRLTTELDAMRSLTERRFEELAGREPDVTPVDELRVRVDQLATREPDQAGFDALRARVDELAAADTRGDETSSLEARLGELEDRLAAATPLAELRDEIRRVAESTAFERASLEQTLLARVEELTATVPREDELTDVRRRLDEIAAQPVIVAELKSRVDALAGRIEGLTIVEAAVSELRVTAEESDEARVGGAIATGARLAGIEAALEAVTGLDARVFERIEHSDSGQAAARDELAERLAAVVEAARQEGEARAVALSSHFDDAAAETRRELGVRDDVHAARLDEAVDAVRSELHGRDGDLAEQLAAQARETVALQARVDELHDLRAEDRAAAELAVGQLAARLDDHALRSAAAALAVEKSVREELDGVTARLEEQDAQGIEAREQLRGELERVGSSIGWRLERIEEALAADDITSLRDAVGELERRLEGQVAIGEEQVRVTERALRKGLASLGERFAESESAYLEAGSTLRRSIERLGAAVVEADARMADQIPVSDAEGYVAFAPTPSGYRLVGIPGAAPELGATVELEECEGPLVVTRYGRSPLPLDSRPCAYLDRA